jgi:hypothetical protein
MKKCLLYLLLLSSKFTEQFSSEFLESKQCQTKSNGTKKNIEKILVDRFSFLHSPNQQKFETCANPKTLTILKNVLAEKNITYVCEDNPVQVIFIICFYDPFSKECKYLINSSGILGGNFLFIFTGFLSIKFFNF